MLLIAISTRGRSLSRAPDGQEDAHTSHSQLSKDTLQEGEFPEPVIPWTGTVKTIWSPVLCRHRGRHMAT